MGATSCRTGVRDALCISPTRLRDCAPSSLRRYARAHTYPGPLGVVPHGLDSTSVPSTEPDIIELNGVNRRHSLHHARQEIISPPIQQYGSIPEPKARRWHPSPSSATWRSARSSAQRDAYNAELEDAPITGQAARALPLQRPVEAQRAASGPADSFRSGRATRRPGRAVHVPPPQPCPPADCRPDPIRTSDP